MYKSKMKSTFSFAKLARSVDKIIGDAVDSVGTTAEQIMKRRIDDGLKPPLEPFTLRMRKKGVGWMGKKVPATNIEKPLLQTGSLYRSLTYIKADKTIKMNSYGQKHQEGFPNPITRRKPIPKREFMVSETDTTYNTMSKSVLKPIGQRLREAFKK